MNEKFVLIIQWPTVLIHLLLVNTWVKEDLTTMTVAVEWETDATAEAVPVLMIDVEDTIAQEAAADLGLANLPKRKKDGG